MIKSSIAITILTAGLLLSPLAVADFSCNRQISEDTGKCVSCYKLWFGRTPPNTGCFTCSSFCFPFNPESAEPEVSASRNTQKVEPDIPPYAQIVEASPCVGNLEGEGPSIESLESQQVAIWTPTQVLEMFPPYALEVQSEDLNGLPTLVQYALLMQRVDRGYINPIILYDFSATLEDFSTEEIDLLAEMGASAWMERQEEQLDLASLIESNAPKFKLRIDPDQPDDHGLHRRIRISVSSVDQSASAHRDREAESYTVVLGPVVSSAPVRYSDDVRGNVYSIAWIERVH